MTKHPPRDAQDRFWRPNGPGAPPSAGRAQAGSQGRWSVRKCSIGCGRWAADSDYGVGYHFGTWRQAMDHAMRATSARTDAIGRPLPPLYSPGGYSPMETK